MTIERTVFARTLALSSHVFSASKENIANDRHAPFGGSIEANTRFLATSPPKASSPNEDS